MRLCYKIIKKDCTFLVKCQESAVLGVSSIINAKENPFVCINLSTTGLILDEFVVKGSTILS